MDKNGGINSPATLSQGGRLKFLLRDSVLYGGAAAASKLFSLFTFPILARCYSTSDYGVIDAFTVLSSLLATLIIFGQDSAVARYFYEYDDTSRRRQVISQSLVIQVLILALSIPVLWFCAGALGTVYTKSEHSESLCRLVVAELPFAVLMNFSQNLLKWTFSRVKFLIVSLCSAASSAVVVVVGVLALGLNVVGLFWCFLLTRFIFAAIGLFFCREWIELPRFPGHVKELLRFGVPYGLICIMAALVPALDRAFVSRYLTMEALGLYAVGFKAALLVSLPIQAFQMAWGPFYLSLFKERAASETYQHVFVYYSVVICFLILQLSFVAEPLVNILASSRYSGSARVVFPLAFGVGIQSIAWIPAIGIDLSKRSYLNLLCYLPGLLATAAAVWLLIKPFGISGVACGVCVGRVVQSALQAWMGRISYAVGMSFRKPLMIILATVAGGLISTVIAFDNVFFDVAVRSVMIIFFVLLVWTVILTAKERSYLRQLVGSIQLAGGPRIVCWQPPKTSESPDKVSAIRF